jgi:hypothetical protein
MAEHVGIREGTGQLRGPDERALDVRDVDGTRRYFLGDEALNNGTEIEIRLRGNEGWIPATVAGLPATLEVVWAADDGKELRSSLPPGVGIRLA